MQQGSSAVEITFFMQIDLLGESVCFVHNS